MITLILFVFALMNWLSPVSPLLLLSLSILALAGSLIYGIPKYRRDVRKLDRLKQGQAGERAVAEYLDTLREDGTRVLHDLIGEGFNLDHVVISQHGIFTIETKTISKRKDADLQIKYDGETIMLGSFKAPRNLLGQARGQASWLRRLLQDAMNKDVQVLPVIVFPGWFIRNEGVDWRKDVWVLEPKALRKFISNEPVRLSSTEIATVTHFLKQHVRNTAANAG